MIKLKNINLNEVKKQYQENGFVVLKNFFEKKTIDIINVDLKILLEKKLQKKILDLLTNYQVIKLIHYITFKIGHGQESYKKIKK